jgi:hypothetical protein
MKSLFFSFLTFTIVLRVGLAQEIQGPTTVYAGQSVQYMYDDGSWHAAYWTDPADWIEEMSDCSGATRTCIRIHWLHSGYKRLALTIDVRMPCGPEITDCENSTQPINLAVIYVNVITCPPTPSTTITVSSYQCGNSLLAYDINPPEYETWYWQTSSGGQSTANNLNQFSVSQSGYYYLRAKNNYSQCWGPALTTQYVTVNSNPLSPTVQDKVICGEPVALQAWTQSGNEIRWYHSQFGGMHFQTGNSLTVNSPVEYYVSSYNPATTCESGRLIIRATGCMSQITGPVTVNAGQLVQYFYNDGLYHSGYYWTDPSEWTMEGYCGGGTTICGTFRWTSTGSRRVALTIDVPVRCNPPDAIECGGTSYEPINLGAINVTVKSCPEIPGTTITISNNNCGNKLLSYSATAPEYETWYWQATSTDQQTAFSSNLFSASASGVYYLRARNNTTLCWSQPLVSAFVTVNPAPLPPLGADKNVCGLDATKLEATPGNNANKVLWYEQAFGSSNFNSENFYWVSSAIEYYISSYNTLTTCESERVLIRAIGAAKPQPPTSVAGNIRFGAGPLLISAEGVETDVAGIRWNDMSNEPKSQSNLYQVADVTEDVAEFGKVYTVGHNGCSSVPLVFGIKVIPSLVIIALPHSFVPGETVNLSVNTGYDSYLWTDNLGNVLGNGHSITVSNKGDFSVQVSKYGVSKTVSHHLTEELQVILGERSLQAGDQWTYTYEDETNHIDPYWHIENGGVVLSEWQEGTKLFATIQWLTPGQRWLYIYKDEIQGCPGPEVIGCGEVVRQAIASAFIDIQGCPAPPQAIFSVSNNDIGPKTISYTGSHGIGVEWIWQTPDGETSTNTSNNFETIQSGVHYLIARNKVTSCLSSPQSTPSIEVNSDPALRTGNNSITVIRTNVERIFDVESMEALPVEMVMQYIDYYDGLGRLLQKISRQSSPSKLDIVTPIVYDGLGRQKRKYLSFAGGNSGSYKDNNSLIGPSGDYSGIAQPFYDTPSSKVADDDGDRPFAETIFESSPLNRPEKEFGPGGDWFANNRFVEHVYLTNVYGTGVGQEKIKAWTIGTNSTPVLSQAIPGCVTTDGNYETGQLYIKSTRDEHGNEVREYTDKEGKIVLKKVQAVAGAINLNSVNDWAFTYYIYDDFGNLVIVLPPEAVKKLTETPGQ